MRDLEHNSLRPIWPMSQCLLVLFHPIVNALINNSKPSILIVTINTYCTIRQRPKILFNAIDTSKKLCVPVPVGTVTWARPFLERALK